MTSRTVRRVARRTHRPLRVGSLCTGYGGLDLAVAELFPTAVWEWCADDDKHIRAVIEARFPGVPNLGDIRAVDWAELAGTAPVDVVTAGFPCQDISLAGNREGITRGNRSGLWFTVLDAVRHLRPGLLVVENVAALRRRGLDTVLAGLAETGYDTQWTSVRAADIGAPHRRDRCFLTAWPGPHLPQTADASCPGRVRAGQARRPAHRDHRAGRRTRHCTVGDPAHLPHREASLSRRGSSSPRPRTSACAEAANPRTSGAPPATDRTWPTRSNTGTTRPARTADHRRHDRPGAAAHAHRERGRQGLTTPTRRPVLRVDAGTAQAPHPKGHSSRSAWDWGPYEPAVTRWTAVVGRRPPHPVHPGPRGKPRLNPAFVEWMMGLPIDPGWVTGIPDLPRTAQLRALGNGVVPQQALHSLRELAADTAESGASNLLTSRPARSPQRHTLRTRRRRLRPPPTSTDDSGAAAPPQTHHHPHHPPTREGHTP